MLVEVIYVEFIRVCGNVLLFCAHFSYNCYSFRIDINFKAVVNITGSMWVAIASVNISGFYVVGWSYLFLYRMFGNLRQFHPYCWICRRHISPTSDYFPHVPSE